MHERAKYADNVLTCQKQPPVDLRSRCAKIVALSRPLPDTADAETARSTAQLFPIFNSALRDPFSLSVHTISRSGTSNFVAFMDRFHGSQSHDKLYGYGEVR